ncbi:MAG: DNA polymerase III subunit epsilon [Beijerinckiaceae bacterium]|nr:DNA polymerase III subunit epsilon [Beijerinckiaceae bacterium]
MQIRELILDTETTGLDPASGDRIVEIGCVEVINSVLTGQTYHVYLDPERDMPEEAFRVHGLSRDFLAGKPKFADISADFLAFVGEARLVIHNAEFDMKFINAELKRCGSQPLGMDRVIDTLAIARRKHPGASNSLDALCSRYKIDNARRTKHGALLDAEILAEVYAELMGGRQKVFELASSVVKKVETIYLDTAAISRPDAIGILLKPDEEAAHNALIEKMGEKALWAKYVS